MTVAVGGDIGGGGDGGAIALEGEYGHGVLQSCCGAGV